MEDTMEPGTWTELITLTARRVQLRKVTRVGDCQLNPALGREMLATAVTILSQRLWVSPYWMKLP